VKKTELKDFVRYGRAGDYAYFEADDHPKFQSYVTTVIYNLKRQRIVRKVASKTYLAVHPESERVIKLTRVEILSREKETPTI